MRHDLVLGLLQQHQLAKFVRLVGFALADDLGVRLKQAEQLTFEFGVAVQNALARLPHDSVAGAE
jgi:hypothetical protein